MGISFLKLVVSFHWAHPVREITERSSIRREEDEAVSRQWENHQEPGGQPGILGMAYAWLVLLTSLLYNN
jgi:hypothetical protein